LPENSEGEKGHIKKPTHGYSNSTKIKDGNKDMVRKK
jgi:hypothetical protein